MTNIYGINDVVDFLSKYGINAEQFIYLLLLYNDKRHGRIPGSSKISRPLSQLYKYHKNVKPFQKNDLEDLVDKGLIKKSGKKLVPDMLEVSDKFEKEYLGDKFKFDQLLEVYPTWVENFNHPSNPKINLKVMKDYDRTASMYNRFVKTYKMHNRVLEVVEWAKENERINLGIEKFVSSKYWESLFELQETEGKMDNHEVI